MLTLTLSQMRRSLGRLIAAGLAIALGTGFVAATFMGTAVFTDTTRATLAAGFGDADLVIENSGGSYTGPMTSSEVSRLLEQQEIDSIHVRDLMWLSVGNGSLTRGMVAWRTPENPVLYPDDVVDGRLPEARHEIALPTPVAQRLELQVGDSVIVYGETYAEDSMEETTPLDIDMTVVGITEPRGGIFSTSSEIGAIHESDIGYFSDPAAPFYYHEASVLLANGVTIEQGRAAVSNVIGEHGRVETPQEAADRYVNDMLPTQVALTTIVLIFAVIALSVAAMVIANTFQVLVAQRAHTLAMLRCVGASSRQVKRSVRIEAVILGAVAAVFGVMGAWGLLQIVLIVGSRMQPNLLLPDMVALNWLTALVPIAAGTLMAYFASRGAGTAATQVPALAALRPLDPPTLSEKRGKARLVMSLLLLVGGGIAASIALIAGINEDISTETALAGVAGFIACFTAVLVSIPLWLPKALNALGAPVARTGPMSRLAIANTRRNPRRTSATSAALLIGVTLVATVAVGAQVAKATINESLDDTYPYDLEINYPSESHSQIIAFLEANEHVAAYATVHPTERLIITTADDVDVAYSDRTAEDEHFSSQSALSVDAEQILKVLRSATNFPLEPGSIVLSPQLFTTAGTTTPWGSPTVLNPGDEVRVYVWPEPDWEAIDWESIGYYEEEPPVLSELDYITMKAVPGTLNDGEGGQFFYFDTFIDATDADQLLPPSGYGWNGSESIWLRIDDIENAQALINSINDDLSKLDAYAWGPVQDRVVFEQAIDIAVKVVYALLAIAVLIAIVGVTNTLSLSVIERRRESATMRTIGLKQKQLRRSLAIEGVFISLAGATLGIVAGVLFGWLGVRMLAGNLTVFSLPLSTLVIVVIGAILAGLLASWVPARMAAKTTPVEALAHE